MFALAVLIALAVALVLGLILCYFVHRQGPGPMGGLVFYVVILFLGTWAAGIWLLPADGEPWDLTWIGFVIVGILLAIILAAASPRRRPTDRSSESAFGPEEAGMTQAVAMTLGVFFYLAIFALFVAVVVGHLRLLYQIPEM